MEVYTIGFGGHSAADFFEALKGWGPSTAAADSPTAALSLEGTVEHMVQEVQARRADGTLAIRHGILTGRVVDPVQAQQEPDGKFYLLDMDYFDAQPQPLVIEGTTKQLRDYNDVMYRFFRWCLSETLYNHLKPEPEHA